MICLLNRWDWQASGKENPECECSSPHLWSRNTRKPRQWLGASQTPSPWLPCDTAGSLTWLCRPHMEEIGELRGWKFLSTTILLKDRIYCHNNLYQPNQHSFKDVQLLSCKLLEYFLCIIYSFIWTAELQRKGEKSSTLWLTLKRRIMPGLNQARVRSLNLHPGLLHGWQEHKHLEHCPLPPGVLS